MGRSLNTFLFIFGGIFIISIFLVFDLFVHTGAPATFDGPTHITNIAQTHAALADGDFPARWGGGFARYGLPAPSIAQQVPSYLGALITFITHDVVMSYNIVLFAGTILATVMMYLFLRLHVSLLPAAAGAFLFHFAPYRIMNIYIRGALPEFFASIFILSTLIGINLAIKKRLFIGYIVIIFSVALLLLTHPFMVVVGSFLFIPYGVFLLWKTTTHEKIKIGVLLFFSLTLSLGLSAYYILPLFIEIKYFYYGTTPSHFAQGHFLKLSQYISESWYYFYQGDVHTRGNYHLGGAVEGVIMITGLLYGAFSLLKKKSFELLHVMVIIGMIIVLFTLPVTEWLYQNIQLLGNIQHPWRMLTAYILVIPVITALFFEKISWRPQALLLLVIIVGVLRFPQLYGKNYTVYPQKSYYLTDYNLHGVVMNTVWSGEARTYPYQKEKVAIIEGNGRIIDLEVRNSSRTYQLVADSDVKIADYTFYFPGWNVYVDGQKHEIQFQDPALRGVITYTLPAGKHTVRTVYEETKTRYVANSITLISGVIVILIVYFRKRLGHIVL